MGRKKFDESKPLHRIAKFYQEKLIKLSDINHRYISNTRAKEILGRFLRIDSYNQVILLNDLEKIGLISRNNQREIEIIPI